MTESRNALMLFIKPPIPGMVKTRLTIERGGILTQEEAASFFHCSIFDMAELAMQALDVLDQANEDEMALDPEAPLRTYDFWISTTPAENVDKMREVFEGDGGQWPRPINYMCDKGSSFDEHFDDAFGQLFAQGYDNVVAIGGDLPTMPRQHIVDAFQWLDYFASIDECGHGFVECPCQECGVSIIGQTKSTPIDSQGVYYNMDGRPALDAYTFAIKQTGVPSAFLSPIADIDEPSDLAHAISCLKAIKQASRYQTDIYVAQRVLDWVNAMHLVSFTPPNANHDPRQYIDGGVDASMPAQEEE